MLDVGTTPRKPNLVILSGAGLSADSGIQTFRGSNGLWEGHDVMKVANGLTWKQNWDLVRQFYNARRANIGTAEPNAQVDIFQDGTLIASTTADEQGQFILDLRPSPLAGLPQLAQLLLVPPSRWLP